MKSQRGGHNWSNLAHTYAYIYHTHHWKDLWGSWRLQYFGRLMQRAKSLGKNPDAGKDWRQEKKEMTDSKMTGWHHQLNGHEFEQALGIGDGQGSLACCSPWGHRVRHDWVIEQQIHTHSHRVRHDWVIEQQIHTHKHTCTHAHTLSTYILSWLSDYNLPNLSNANFAHQMYMRRLITTCLNPQKYQQW